MIQMRRVTVIPDFMQMRFRSPQAAAAAADWWLSGGISAANAIAVYQPKGADDLADSYINLANPGTYNAAPGVAPTWASGTGWTFNGTTQYLTTGLLPNCGVWSMLIRYADLSGVNKTILGSYDSAPPTTMLFQTQGGIMRTFASDSTGFYADNVPQLLTGVYGVSAKTPYRDGSAESNIVSGGTTVSVEALYIGALNLNGSPAQYAPVKIQAFAIYDATLTAPQVAAVSTAMSLL